MTRDPLTLSRFLFDFLFFTIVFYSIRLTRGCNVLPPSTWPRPSTLLRRTAMAFEFVLKTGSLYRCRFFFFLTVFSTAVITFIVLRHTERPTDANRGLLCTPLDNIFPVCFRRVVVRAISVRRIGRKGRLHGIKTQSSPLSDSTFF